MIYKFLYFNHKVLLCLAFLIIQLFLLIGVFQIFFSLNITNIFTQYNLVIFLIFINILLAFFGIINFALYQDKIFVDEFINTQIVFIATCLLLGIEALDFSRSAINIFWFYFINCLGYSLLVFAITSLYQKHIHQLNFTSSYIFAVILTSLFALSSLIYIFASTWLNLFESSKNIFIHKNIILSFIPMLYWMFKHYKYIVSFSFKTLFSYLKIYSINNKKKFSGFYFFIYSALFLSNVIYGICGILYVFGYLKSWYYLHLFNTDWMFFGGIILYQLFTYNFIQFSNNILLSLVHKSQKYFVQNYIHENINMSFARGVRTARFFINHDPYNLLQSKLPSTFVMIRNKEIENLIFYILSDKTLHINSVGNQIYGIIDPISTVTPCLNSLIMSCVMYLDIFYFVENKLKIFSKVLPIIDEDFAQHIDLEKIQLLSTHYAWFFHLEYGWVDEYMLFDINRSQYKLFINEMNFLYQFRIFEYLRNKNLLENFICISDNFRKRLLQESPFLSDIIESTVISIDDVESILFLIRFDKLVPMLQKYYSLEQMRSKILYYNITEETHNMISIIKESINNISQNFNEFYFIIDLIKSHNWNGFKEKDLVLELIIELYNKAISLYSPLIKNEKNFLELKDELKNLIFNIGYPAKELYLAHKEKVLSRKMDLLLSTSQNIKNTRFYEVWAFLATCDLSCYSDEDLKKLFDFLINIPNIARFKNNRFVMSKTIEILKNLLTVKVFNIDEIQSFINRYAEWIIKYNSDIYICDFYLDFCFFVEQMYNHSLTFESTLIIQFNKYLNMLNYAQVYDKKFVNQVLQKWDLLKHHQTKAA